MLDTEVLIFEGLGSESAKSRYALSIFGRVDL